MNVNLMQSEHKREIGLIAFDDNVLPTQKGQHMCVPDHSVQILQVCNKPSRQADIHSGRDCKHLSNKQ